MSVDGNKLLKVILTAIVLVIPTVFAAHLVQAVTQPLRMVKQSSSIPVATKGNRSATGPGTAGGLLKVINPEATSPKSLVMGVLYTKGRAMVDWNGVRIPLQNGSYAYVGGEIIQMAPDAIGLLKLADGGSVYVCPGSKVRLSRIANGQYSLSLVSGSSRFRFPADKAFQVKVNDVVITGGGDSQASATGNFASAEIHAKQKSGCIICALKSNLKVTTPGAAGGGSESGSAAGGILDVTTDHATQTASYEKTPIPMEIMSGLTMAGGAGPGKAYLCRCQEIQRYARDLARARTAIAQSEARQEQATAQPQETPATTPVKPIAEASVALPEPAPPVAPPEAPPLALAIPGAPDPFDPNVLPPPAAGEANEPILVVAPAVVPVAGSGGGLDASPS